MKTKVWEMAVLRCFKHFYYITLCFFAENSHDDEWCNENLLVVKFTLQTQCRRVEYLETEPEPAQLCHSPVAWDKSIHPTISLLPFPSPPPQHFPLIIFYTAPSPLPASPRTSLFISFIIFSDCVNKRSLIYKRLRILCLFRWL